MTDHDRSPRRPAGPTIPWSPLVVALAGQRVAIRVGSSRATVADLARALGSDEVLMEGTRLDPGRLLAEVPLHRGAALDGPRPPAGPALVWRTGASAGTRLPLPAPGQVLVVCPPATSGRPSRGVALLEGGDRGSVTLVDLGVTTVLVDDRPVPTGGRVEVAPGSRVDVGDHTGLLVAPSRPPAVAPDQVDRGAGWTVAWHRPPRQPPEDDGALLQPPAAPVVPPPPAVSHVPALLTTAASSLVLALVLRTPLLALMGAVSILASMGMWVGSRVHRAWALRRARADHRRALATFSTAVEAARVRAQRAARSRPGPAEALARSHQPDGSLWARRPGVPGSFKATLGLGDRAWVPSLAGATGPEVAATVAGAGPLRRVPVELALGPGEVVGLAGPPEAVRALARSLVLQLAVAHGPVDLAVAVASAEAAAEAEGWCWAAWLPHVALDPEPLVEGGTGAAPRLAERLREHRTTATCTLVVDAGAGMARLPGGLRKVLAPSSALLVTAERVDDLPAGCTTVVILDGQLATSPTGGFHADRVAWAGIGAAEADAAARRLARYRDPEAGDRSLPVAAVTLADVLGTPDASELVRRWVAAGPDPAPRAVVGVASDDPLTVDLAVDGPHVVIAGTTGSGKSELLRALVAGLAAGASPEHVTFLLVDFKGGSAFDACAGLPHVVGVVTDLDGELADRVTRSLAAEVRRREALLRASGATDLTAHRAAGGAPPLPRLVVVVDEFAELAREQPGFLPQLLTIARRGRSLGVHLVLATQRPAGAVSDDVRANVNLRIALRVQDPADSVDVLGDAAAAHLPRHCPGRAVARFGPGELVAFQSVLATAPARSRPAVEVLAGVAAPGSGWVAATGGTGGADGMTVTELAVLVEAACDAADRLGLAPPRRPWLDPLPTSVDLDTLPPGTVAVADDPDQQARVSVEWQPAHGNLLVCGAPGSGTTTALTAVLTALAGSSVHTLVVGRRLPSGLGASAFAEADLEGVARLVRVLWAELERRRAGGVDDVVVLAVDGLDTLRGRFDAAPAVLDQLDALVAEGPSYGILVVASARRPGNLPTSLLAAFACRWVLRLADPADAATVGVAPRRVHGIPAGRFVDAVSGLVAQIGRPPVARSSAPPGEASSRRRGAVEALPTRVGADALPPPVPALEGPVRIPVGLVDHPAGLHDGVPGPAVLTLHPGEHVMVAGRPRSGRTAALALLAGQLRAAWPGASVLGVAPRPSPVLARSCDRLVRDLASLELPDHRPLVLVVDDVELLDDHGDALTGLAADPRVRLVVAGRAEALRSAYGHWTVTVRRSRSGLLLGVPGELDGDLLGVMLPRRPCTSWPPGRAELVEAGSSRLVQLAHPLV